MKKLIFSLACAILLIVVPATASSQTTPQTSTQNKNYLPENIQDGVILHCFVWPLQDVIAELPNIAEAGFTAVQISPMQAPNVAG